MIKYLQERLFKEFPALYKRRHLDRQLSCLTRGIECGDGWFDLLWGMSEQLQKAGGCDIEQVKQKFGTLTVYAQPSPPLGGPIFNIFGEWATKSKETCETCGGPGKFGYRGFAGGHMCVMCDFHANQTESWRVKYRREEIVRLLRDLGPPAYDFHLSSGTLLVVTDVTPRWLPLCQELGSQRSGFPVPPGWIDSVTPLQALAEQGEPADVPIS